MRDYELALVLPGGLTPAKQKAILDKIEKAVEDSGGKLGKTEEAGKKELAYPIKKERQGIFFYAPLSLPADKVKDFDRMLIVDEVVLRHLLVKSNTSSTGIKGKKTEKKKVVK
ncbi:MAG: 30S ribosomal protein S6 [bacterium]|nr:30S ribosomal protein S6 [bacterium]